MNIIGKDRVDFWHIMQGNDVLTRTLMGKIKETKIKSRRKTNVAIQNTKDWIVTIRKKMIAQQEIRKNGKRLYANYKLLMQSGM